MTDGQLVELLQEIGSQAVLIEGPTGCGKTRAMKLLNEKIGEDLLLLPEDYFIQSMLKSVGADVKARPLAELFEGRKVICIEEADLMSGKRATQESAAEYLGKAASGALVILSGIKLRERIPALIERLNVPIRLIEYRTEQE